MLPPLPHTTRKVPFLLLAGNTDVLPSRGDVVTATAA